MVAASDALAGDAIVVACIARCHTHIRDTPTFVFLVNNPLACFSRVVLDEMHDELLFLLPASCQTEMCFVRYLVAFSETHGMIFCL